MQMVWKHVPISGQCTVSLGLRGQNDYLQCKTFTMQSRRDHLPEQACNPARKGVFGRMLPFAVTIRIRTQALDSLEGGGLSKECPTTALPVTTFDGENFRFDGTSTNVTFDGKCHNQKVILFNGALRRRHHLVNT